MAQQILRNLDEYIVKQEPFAKREEHTVGFLMADIDYFKLVNDTYGHAAGDEALRQCARLCRQLIGDNGVAARIGGEEFAMVMAETTLDGAIQVAERIRTVIGGEPFRANEVSLTVTISVGVATTSQISNALSKSRRMRVRTFWARR